MIILKEDDKNRYLVSIATKRSFTKGRFDSIFGIGITLRNWLSGIFDSYAHTELDFLDGWSWSASESMDRIDINGKKCGVGWKNVEYSHPERWVRTTVDIRDKRLKKNYANVYILKEECLRLTGRDYDLLGCLGQAIDIPNLEDRSKFYCSEAVGHVFGIPPMSPAKFFNYIRKLLDK